VRGSGREEPRKTAPPDEPLLRDLRDLLQQAVDLFAQVVHADAGADDAAAFREAEDLDRTHGVEMPLPDLQAGGAQPAGDLVGTDAVEGDGDGRRAVGRREIRTPDGDTGDLPQ